MFAPTGCASIHQRHQCGAELLPACVCGSSYPGRRSSSPAAGVLCRRDLTPPEHGLLQQVVAATARLLQKLPRRRTATLLDCLPTILRAAEVGVAAVVATHGWPPSTSLHHRQPQLMQQSHHYAQLWCLLQHVVLRRMI
jgi:hypothetical protein